MTNPQKPQGQKRDGNTKTGPLSKHMEPRDFERMNILQRNDSKHFNPKFKLKTDTLKKVLYRLKKEKEDIDKNLE